MFARGRKCPKIEVLVLKMNIIKKMKGFQKIDYKLDARTDL